MLSDYAEPGTLEDCRLMPEGLIMVLHSHLWHCLLDMWDGLHLCRWFIVSVSVFKIPEISLNVSCFIWGCSSHSSLPRIIAVLHDTTDQSFKNKASVVFVDEIFILPFWRMPYQQPGFSLLEIRQWEGRLQKVQLNGLISALQWATQTGLAKGIAPHVLWLVLLEKKPFPLFRPMTATPKLKWKLNEQDWTGVIKNNETVSSWVIEFRLTCSLIQFSSECPKRSENTHNEGYMPLLYPIT